MSDLKPEAEMARKIAKNLVVSLRMTGEEAWDVLPMFEEALTADRESVARRVREKCMHEVAALKHPHDGVDTRAIWSNAAYGDAVAAIRNLPLEVLLEND